MRFFKPKKALNPLPDVLPANFKGWDNHQFLLYGIGADEANAEKINKHLEQGFPCYIWFGQFEHDRDRITDAGVSGRKRLLVKVKDYWLEPSPGTRIELC
jgi:hypothetical protein